MSTFSSCAGAGIGKSTFSSCAGSGIGKSTFPSCAGSGIGKSTFSSVSFKINLAAKIIPSSPIKLLVLVRTKAAPMQLPKYVNGKGAFRRALKSAGSIKISMLSSLTSESSDNASIKQTHT
ncbi:hypothetical protein FRX31_028619 [Thalictrum thalictroides]|uniref:Uncharacterized protein n=1 Tax=Thalictrum thalictroides TaxID=46969 RepID=A0A7J6V9M1_THATH|nr:hypothetical protein FRX31_028619 [Thalictrum thalictroides]